MSTELSRYDVAEQYWPYDGPHDEEAIATAAAVMTDLVRYLNNATYRDMPAPALYNLLGDLNRTVFGLEQLAGHAADMVERYSRDTTLSHATHRDDQGAATHAAKLATQALRAAPAALSEVASSVDDARQHLAHLYHQHEGR